MRDHRHGLRAKASLVLLAVMGLSLAACSDSPSALDPKGPRASEIADLWWTLFSIGAVVWIIVVALLVFAVARKRRKAQEEPETGGSGSKDPIAFVLIAGGVIPFLVLVALFVFTLQTMTSAAASGSDSDLTIEVIGHRWWWEVRYPQQQFTTANEVHIPAGQKVQLKLSSDDVIHSFWVPQLQGKMDLIPGQTNTLWIEADQAGTYRGQCAEYCGVQHANMAFTVVADDANTFAGWLQTQQQPAANSSTPMLVRGEQVFFGSACVYCHAVRGTSASGTVGPDLTHLGSRGQLAAGTVKNDPGNLAAWILDPQGMKPGNLMPPTQVNAEDLHALLAYLESLK